MKKLTILYILIAFASIASFARKPQEYKLDVGQFTAIQLQDNVNVVYRCVNDTTGSVRWESDDRDFANSFIFTVNGNTLKIQVNPEDLGKPDMPTVYVYSDYLNKVLNYSDFDINVESIAPCPKLELSQIGNGNISANGVKATEVVAKVTAGMGNIAISGDCRLAVLRMMGTGIIQADNLRADQVRCKIIGGGTIGCWPVELLKTRGIGSTRIYYKGSPEIDHKGGGKLLKIN